jgi:DNA-binding transcriptional ArsR family regulator
VSAAPRLAVDVVEDARRAHALLQPQRLALLQALETPASAAGLARRLGLPRQRVNYHLRELEAARLVELVEEKSRGSCTERTWRRTGASYALSPAALGALAPSPEAIQDRFSCAYQIALASRAVRELGLLQGAARAEGKSLPTFALEVELSFSSPASRAAFAEELASAVAELVRRHHDERAQGGRAYRFYLGGHPRLEGGG